MRKTLVTLCATALASLLVSGPGARAETIPWGYKASDTEIFANALETSSIAFKGSSGVAVGDSGIIIYNLETASTATSATADTFSSVPFDLKVTLSDVNSSGSTDAGAIKTGTLDFKGTFSASNVTKSSLFPGAITYDATDTSPLTLKLGSADTGFRNYSVYIKSATEPGQPGGALGSIQAVVTVVTDSGPTGGDPPGGGGSGGPGPTATPEPSSLLLAGLGVPVFFFRRRQRAA